MKQVDYVISSLRWSGEGIKEQLRRIELDLNKIISSKLGIYEEFIEISYLIKLSQNLFSEFYKRLFLSMHTTMSKLSLKKLFEAYYVRSYFYIKKALKSDNPKLLPVIVGPISFGIYFILVGVLL